MPVEEVHHALASTVYALDAGCNQCKTDAEKLKSQGIEFGGRKTWMAMSVFLITGCSSGLGAEMAKVALERGFKVIATARRIETLQSLKEKGATVLPLDVTAPPEELAAFAKSTWEIHGQIDYLVNNAGYLQSGAIEEHTPAEILTQFNTHVFGVINLTTAFLPFMRARKTGTLVNITSQNGCLSFPGTGIYSASKAALELLSDTWSKELAEFGIRSIAIQMGMHRTSVAKPTNIKRATGVPPGPPYVASTQAMDGYVAIADSVTGDPAKAAQHIVDFVTQTTELPLRLPMGDATFEGLRQFYTERLADIEKHKSWSVGTDFTA
ncbi:Short-chain dehydrogenase/reductase family protein [Mycena kentingensis (nom. inval.)]|nr:Short-chain dehydrogenase/reductase family protein [Mycena kentingensis (nom. inval.)]